MRWKDSTANIHLFSFASTWVTYAVMTVLLTLFYILAFKASRVFLFFFFFFEWGLDGLLQLVMAQARSVPSGSIFLDSCWPLGAHFLLTLSVPLKSWMIERLVGSLRSLTSDWKIPSFSEGLEPASLTTREARSQYANHSPTTSIFAID